jgi:hypothetical protein
MIDKVKTKLDRWGKAHPMMRGRMLISQAIIGGHTQFLMRTQGMLVEIENALLNTMRNFIWEDNSSPRIAPETLYLPLDKGGLKLLDIRARNEAIGIIWLKDYLNMPPSCPLQLT